MDEERAILPMPRARDTLREPLLPPAPSNNRDAPATNQPSPTTEASPPLTRVATITQGTGLVGSTILLAKAIVGAGSAALPLAFARLGVLFSVTFLLAIAFMTHFSLEALTLGIVTSGRPSYPAAVRALLGPAPASFLELCLVLRCAGLMIVYIVISTDLLAGSQALPGLLCEIFGSPTTGWCGDRHLIAVILVNVVLAPLVAPKKLSSTKLTSILGLSAVIVWTVVTAVVAIAAAIKGIAYEPEWLPNPEALGGGSFASQSIVALATIPVIATAYTCQMTVAFVVGELRNFTTNRMAVVSAGAVGLCSLVFLVVGLGSITAFGHTVPADILELFSTSVLVDKVGPAAASALGIIVRLGFLMSILANMPLQMLPYRQSFARLVLGGDHEFAGLGYSIVTYGSLAIFYFIAMAAKSIWVPIQLVGATAGAAIAFFFPAAVALAVVREWQRRGVHAGPAGDLIKAGYWKTNAWILVAIGVVQVVTGITAIILERSKNNNGNGNNFAAPWH